MTSFFSKIILPIDSPESKSIPKNFNFAALRPKPAPPVINFRFEMPPGMISQDQHENQSQQEDSMPLSVSQKRKKKRAARREALQNVTFDREGLGDPLEESVIPDCAICISPCKKSENLRWLPCMHVFHSKCIKQWSKQKKICPLCKKEFIN